MAVYITAIASFYLGDVDIENSEDYASASEKLWESRDYETPTLCHQCAEVDLGEWKIDDSDLKKF